MHFTIRVALQRKDGTTAMTELLTTDHGSCESAAEVGMKLVEASDGACVVAVRIPAHAEHGIRRNPKCYP